jgi:hypothetical protein
VPAPAPLLTTCGSFGTQDPAWQCQSCRSLCLLVLRGGAGRIWWEISAFTGVQEF